MCAGLAYIRFAMHEISNNEMAGINGNVAKGCRDNLEVLDPEYDNLDW